MSNHNFVVDFDTKIERRFITRLLVFMYWFYEKYFTLAVENALNCVRKGFFFGVHAGRVVNRTNYNILKPKVLNLFLTRLLSIFIFFIE